MKPTKFNDGSAAAVSLDPAHFARERVEDGSLGKCIIGEILNYLVPLGMLADVAGTPDRELRQRCNAIEGLITMAIRFAEEMDGLMEHTVRKSSGELDALVAAMKGGVK